MDSDVTSPAQLTGKNLFDLGKSRQKEDPRFSGFWVSADAHSEGSISWYSMVPIACVHNEARVSNYVS